MKDLDAFILKAFEDGYEEELAVPGVGVTPAKKRSPTAALAGHRLQTTLAELLFSLQGDSSVEIDFTVKISESRRDLDTLMKTLDMEKTKVNG